MSSARRIACALLVVGVMTPVTACAPGDSSADDSASCVYRVTYQGRTYRDVANVEFTVGAELGDAVKPPCDDTGEGGEAGSTETAYAVTGVSPEVAIAVGDTPGDTTFVAVYSGNELPPEVKKLVKGS
ncbi:DUF6281 family protein [Streptomyces sp. NPDC048179]|uniref:DUF6281 family protein n=1 Tax=Streptomyces sp. NPDC048179 TaxID=3365506 RepID=UPI00371A48EA